MAAANDEATRSVFTAADDEFHFEALGGDWWATETSWFSFHNTDRRLGGWLYTMVRPNIGTVAGGAWVWDDSAWLPWEVEYSSNYSCLQLPQDVSLLDAKLPSGVSIRAMVPGQRYDISYSDEGRLEVSLRFEGVMPPEPLTAVGSPFGNARHFDQIGRVSGNVLLHGEHIEIDCYAMRDRTWGRRPEDRPRQSAYVTGAVSEHEGFLAVTDVRRSGDDVAYGFLRREGITAGLEWGRREVERDLKHGWVTKITLSATDRKGRRLEAIGKPVSRMIVNRHTFIDINSLIRWKIDGMREGWGEDQDMWPVHLWAERQRAARSHVRSRKSCVSIEGAME